MEENKTELTKRQIIARKPRMHVVEPHEPRKRNPRPVVRINIEIAPAERDTLQALAAAAGQDMRSYIATAINAHAGYTVIALTRGKGNRTPRKQDSTEST